LPRSQSDGADGRSRDGDRAGNINAPKGDVGGSYGKRDAYVVFCRVRVGPCPEVFDRRGVWIIAIEVILEAVNAGEGQGFIEGDYVPNLVFPRPDDVLIHSRLDDELDGDRGVLPEVRRPQDATGVCYVKRSIRSG